MEIKISEQIKKIIYVSGALFALGMLFVLGIFVLSDHLDSSENKQPLQFSEDMQIEKIIPERSGKAVSIKLRRTVKGNYTWTLRGRSVEEIVETDRRLRELLDEK
ncbi:hypothetical protein M1N62_05055 [Thermodesulfovibrionales bacterium]|nr:hypothetical protein [Thermodesulfovibrionales bacterium]